MRHLLTLWNPSYQDDALEAHTELLLHYVREADDGAGSWDDAYVWWGRVRSSHRQQPLPHLNEVLALGAEAQQRELQLYLTDYRSLYVACVIAIAQGDKSSEDPSHTPAYYAERGLHADCWFCLSDIRCLIQDDTLATQDELRQLRNTHYNDQPVSLYGGMVNLPLIVTRPDGALFFSEQESELLNDGRHWVQADAERSGLSGLVADLQDNVIGESAWHMLLPAARTFVATAERLMRDHRRDAAFDFSTVIIELCKAIEVQVNAIVAEVMRAAPPAVRFFNMPTGPVDLSQQSALSAGQLSKAIAFDKERLNYFAKHLTESRFFVEELPIFLEELAVFRGPAAHSARRSRADVLRLRNRIVGVGEEGILVKLARVGVKGR